MMIVEPGGMVITLRALAFITVIGKDEQCCCAYPIL